MLVMFGGLNLKNSLPLVPFKPTVEKTIRNKNLIVCKKTISDKITLSPSMKVFALTEN